MEKYFNQKDITTIEKYCSGKSQDEDFGDPIENENVIRVIQLVLSSELYLSVDNYKNNVGFLVRLIRA